mmetsp:Transcript_25538/g.71421  ORF Transcript_25538/g.71421 Transcript_25538/m.71421 type:complete len:82 (+) Transcript_25538:188-433(+)
MSVLQQFQGSRPERGRLGPTMRLLQCVYDADPVGGDAVTEKLQGRYHTNRPSADDESVDVCGTAHAGFHSWSAAISMRRYI